MTEYGRGQGSEPWRPDDPLYGDQGWNGQQAVSGQMPYGGEAHQQYPGQAPQYAGQEPYGQQQHQQQYGQDQQQYPQDQQYAQQQGYAGQDPYAAPGPEGQDAWNGGQYPQQAQQHQQGGTGQFPADPSYNADWDLARAAGTPYAGSPADALGGQPGGYAPETGTGYPDQYATADAYPPPEPPARRTPAAPEPTPWEADAPEEEKHAFFTGDDGDDDGGDGYDDRDGPGRGSGGDRRGKGKKKSRNGCACLVVSLVLVGGLGGVAYFGYQFWEGRFAPPEDFSGAGSGTVMVEIPKDAGLLEIGGILKRQGVVKSAGAFVSAANKDPEKALGIQDGVYVLAKEMSGANAVQAMLNPSSRSAMIIPEGKRNNFVYAEIDKRLGLKAGTTKVVAKEKVRTLGLPDWAGTDSRIKDPLEGFLFPASYPVAKGMKPEDVLKKMIARAKQEFGQKNLNTEAERLGLKSPLEILTVASLVQAEGKYKQDFDKVARVVYNRLKPGNTETIGRLEFDSTVNYVLNKSTLQIGSVDEVRKIKDPYNTYNVDVKGLPPGPIGNPGMSAFNSALDPTPGPWYYFVSVSEDETIFAVTNKEHERNRRKYLEQQENSGQ
jgi:UPF0755 protein